jgi:hypothetical protein
MHTNYHGVIYIYKAKFYKLHENKIKNEETSSTKLFLFLFLQIFIYFKIYNNHFVTT